MLSKQPAAEGGDSHQKGTQESNTPFQHLAWGRPGVLLPVWKERPLHQGPQKCPPKEQHSGGRAARQTAPVTNQSCCLMASCAFLPPASATACTDVKAFPVMLPFSRRRTESEHKRTLKEALGFQCHGISLNHHLSCFKTFKNFNLFYATSCK